MTEKVVVVTGASSGIGAALAAVLAHQGHALGLLARREPELVRVAATLPNALPIVTDVTHRDQVEYAFAAVKERFGRVDVWVNNAGRGISRPVSTLSDDDIDDMIRINVKSVLYGMQTVLPHFRERRRGHIVNVSSLLGRVPFAPIRSAYSAAKHAMNSLTANLRMELRSDFPEIHVSAVHPGVVATEFGLHALHGGVDSRTLPNSQTAEEVAQVIADVIEHPRADVYTRPGAQQMIVSYFSAPDMADAEKHFGLPPPRPSGS